MDEGPQTVREQALAKLAEHGITGVYVYLIDLIPLIEILWADGKAQEGELKLFEEHLRKQVRRINELAGTVVIDYIQAAEFVGRFLQERPDPALLKTLRSLIVPVRLSSSDAKENHDLAQSLLQQCLDIASSAVTKYPYGIHDRFDLSEKKVFFEILETLAGKY
jgi:hypothetical protein